MAAPPPSSPPIRAVARGASWMLPASLLGNAALLGLDVYTNGLLSTEDYGLYAAARRVAQLLAFVVLLGMENAVIRAVATARDDAGARGAVRLAVAWTFGASVLVGVLGLGVLRPFAAWIDPGPAAATVLGLGLLSLPLAAFRTVAVSAAQGRGQLRDRAVVMFVAWPLAQLVGLWCLVGVGGRGVVGAMAAWVGALAIGATLAGGLLARSWPGVTGQGEARAATLWATAWPLWIQGILMAVYTWADQVLLAGLGSVELAGVYGPVASLVPLFGVGLGALNGAFAPAIAVKHQAGDLVGLQRLYRTVTRWALVLALPPVVVCLVAPEAVLAVWPNGSAAAAPALRIAAAAQLFATAVGSVNYLLIMSGRARAVLGNAVPAMGVALGLSVALIPPLGVTGAALAAAGAALVANGIGLVQVWIALRIHPFGWSMVRPLAAGVLGAVGVLGLAHGIAAPVPLVAAASALAGVVQLAGMAAGGLDPDDRVVVDAFLRKLGR